MGQVQLFHSSFTATEAFSFNKKSNFPNSFSFNKKSNFSFNKKSNFKKNLEKPSFLNVFSGFNGVKRLFESYLNLLLIALKRRLSQLFKAVGFSYDLFFVKSFFV